MEENELIISLFKEIGFNDEEIKAYLLLLKNKSITIEELSISLNINNEESIKIITKFERLGMLIKGSNGKYKCLHPRMGLTNVFKIWEEEIYRMIKKRKAIIELLVRYLSKIYEE